MRNIFLFASLALCFAIPLPLRAEDDKAPKPNDDQAQIQGSWKVVRRLKNGTDEDTKQTPVTLTFKGNAVVEARGDDAKAGEGTFSIDPATKPKTMVLTGTSGEHAGQVFKTIYELTGDTLKIAYCTREGGNSPPTDFTGGEGSGMMVLERDKP